MDGRVPASDSYQGEDFRTLGVPQTISCFLHLWPWEEQSVLGAPSFSAGQGWRGSQGVEPLRLAAAAPILPK